MGAIILGAFAIKTARVSPRLSAGFNLIEILVVVAITGILLSIAVSNYQISRVRAKVSEGMAILKLVQRQTEEYYASKSSFPTASDLGYATGGATLFATSLVPVAGTSMYLAPLSPGVHMNIVYGATIGNDFHLTVSLEGCVTASGVFTWSCGVHPNATSGGTGIFGSTEAVKYMPASCQKVNPTTISC